MDELQFSDNPEAQHYEARQNSGQVVAFIEYRMSGETRVFTHTEVNPEMEGKGVGSALVKYALEDLKSRGEHVVPMCPFVKTYLQRHHEYLDLVDPGHREMFGL